MKTKKYLIASMVTVLVVTLAFAATGKIPVDLYRLHSIAPPYYGELSVSNGTSSQVLTTQNVWYKLNGFTTNGESSETTPDHTLDKITVENGDHYLISLTGSIFLSKSETFKLAVYVNGVALPEATQQFYDKVGDNEQALSISAISYIEADGDVEVYAICTSNGGKSVQLKYATLTVSSVKGETGPQGMKGDKGDQGDQGIQGIQGMKGDKGDTGDQGIQGMKGDKGDQGDQGIQGDKGDKGDKGDQGIQGIQGEKGDKGDKGDQGIQGEKGDKGDQGIQGEKGNKGDQGDQGIQGEKGDKGDQGPEGLLTPGAAAGNTPYWNGSQWVVNSSNIYNNGAKVGIGTATPDQQLEVRKDQNNRTAIRITNNTGGNNAFSELLLSTDQAQLGTIFKNSTLRSDDGGANTMTMRNDGGDLRLQSGGGNGIIVKNSSGNVGIGTATPISKLHLQVPSGYIENHVQSGSSSVDFGVNNVAGGYVFSQQNIPIYFGTNAQERMRIAADGKVGIGTANPLAKLDLAGNIKIADGTQAAGKVLTSDANGLASWQPAAAEVDPQVSSATTHRIPKWNGTSLMDGVITDDGNLVSMNTTYLQVGTPTSDATFFGLTRVGSMGRIYMGTGGASPDMVIQAMTASGDVAFATNAGEVMRVVDGGKVGIGTANPLAKLDLAGNIKIADGTQAAGKVLTSDANGLASWQPSAAEVDPQVSSATTHRIPKWNGTTLTDGIITDNGTNVGIGTPSPSAKLDVVGGDALINGIRVGKGNGSHNQNTAVGLGTLGNATGGLNTAIGYAALANQNSGVCNTSIGASSMENAASGNNNTAVGFSSLWLNQSGEQNMAFGSYSLLSNNSGSNNIAIGSNAMRLNNSGNSNTAVGTNALFSNIAGAENVAIGQGALNLNTQGSNNTAIGIAALNDNETGVQNTALGHQALWRNSTGYNNTAIGFSSNVASGNLNNATAVGANATVDASNKVVIGNTSVTSIGGQVGWTIYSDARVKDQVKENVPGLKFINALKPVTFHYNIAKQNKLMGIESKIESRDRSEIEEIPFTGFLAQDVDAAAQRIGYNFSGIDRTGKIMGLRYADFVVPIVKAVQELSDKVETMNAPAAADQKKMTELENQIIEHKQIIIDQSNQIKEHKQIIGDQQNQIDDLNSKLDQVLNKLNAFDESLSKCCTHAVDHHNLHESDEPRLEQNVPNPFGHSTYIKFYVPRSSKTAKLMVTDERGSVVMEFDNLEKGFGTVNIQSSSFASGTYYYTLVIDDRKVETKSMIFNY